MPSTAPVLAPVPARRADPDAFDWSYALGRLRDWLLGPAPLAANLALALFAGLGVVLWRLSRDPNSFGLPWWLVVWALVVVIHAAVVVLWASLRGWRSARRPGPVYYAQIPIEQRTRRRRVDPAPRPAAAPVAGSTPAEPTPASWQGVLAPVTPFPTLRTEPTTRGREGSPLPPAPGRADVSAGAPPIAPPAAPAPPAPPPSPALQSARDLLASDQPLWRRLRRRSGPASTGGALPDPAPLPAPPVDGPASWLAPFPGAPPVTRTTPDPADRAGEPSTDTPKGHPTAFGAAAPSSDPSAGGIADEQIPSLAAMLRSSNLTAMSEAPIVAGNGRHGSTGAGRPERAMPDAARPAATGSPASTSALFAAFGIESDGSTVGNGPTGSAPVRDDRTAALPSTPAPATPTATTSAPSPAATPNPAPDPNPPATPAWGPVTTPDAPNAPPARPASPTGSTSISRQPTPINRPR